jgi:hypothetical protein
MHDLHCFSLDGGVGVVEVCCGKFPCCLRATKDKAPSSGTIIFICLMLHLTLLVSYINGGLLLFLFVLAM